MTTEGAESRRLQPAAGIAEVARVAGVSNMTVSRVINDQPGVGARTRARIRVIMEELNYRPNSTARALKTGRPTSIGIICLATTLYGPAVTLFGVEQAARAAGFSANVISLNAITKVTLEQATAQLRQLPVAATIIISPLSSSAESLRDLPDEPPTVAIWAPSDLDVSVAAVDHEHAAAAATQHLVSLGHETVWHVSGPLGWTGAEHRVAGWRRALEQADRPVPEPVEGDWTARSGFEAGLAILRDRAVTAVFAANDQMALGVLRAARVLGRRVPEDLSVVGYDDGPDSAYYSPPLTTIRQDFTLLGERALQLALARIGHPARPAPDTLVEPELVIRESTAPPPR
ncbi:LacI family DNA-binding transcriptional regulator [Nonomuraea sp. K274]|uniref:LacI family DNA-binding transcriptional regulator n=1 Tax=Nonomuraea cypriaca TaxID=1187855 RepID=A0A931AH49_9ACTN|nr:LacI family DNA-binding transcriptional regulator [Nonomuraea cypriaca]MBF8192596.1 LacI family DNA-binding transcriptional regulator [Nonomuraea cypriaca]